ncbi:MAG TPA: hypothetical protein VFG39_07555, partial [Balneolaceae bacterium]|nr:hypothetical protein [Balneolaceae bacterium]
MNKRLSQNYLKLLIPVLLGITLLFIPLLGNFHIESAILVSLIGCFWATIRACDKNRSVSGDFFAALQITGYLFLVGFPLLIYALLTGCFSFHGLAFWLLFPLPSVFFGYAIGRLLRIWGVPFRRTLAVIILLAVGFGLLLIEFFSFPQLYFFNHVWGGWPGPIYDEIVRVDSSAIFFRTLTLLWALFLWHIPVLKKDRLSLIIVVLSAVAIGFSYTQFAEMGVISPRSYLQEVLGEHKETAHFELFYDERF